MGNIKFIEDKLKHIVEIEKLLDLHDEYFLTFLTIGDIV